MIPYEIQDGFETGEKSAWETYPFFQDMGFNPTLSCVVEPVRNGCYSLSQTFIPSDTDFPTDFNQVGIIKRIHITTAVESRLKVSIFVESDRRPTHVEFSLCTMDGRRFIASLSEPSVNQWIDIDISLSDFLLDGSRLGPDTGLEAITIVAEFGVVSPRRSYSLTIDSFTLNGKRRHQFLPVSPEGTWLEHFQRTVLHRHYRPGEDISISVKSEAMKDNNLPKSVFCTVMDANGIKTVKDVECMDDGTCGDEVCNDGIWSRQSIYRLVETDPPGRWHIFIKGITQHNSIIESTFDFLVPSISFSKELHPRLLFSNEDLMRRSDLRLEYPLLDQLFTEAVQSTRKRIEEETINKHPEYNNINPEYLGGGSFSPSWDQFDQWINGLNASVPAKDLAFLYSFTGDEAMGERGKEFLLHVCRFNTWNHPWMKSHGIQMYYPVGYTAYRVAMAFDLLYPLLSPVERILVREALLQKAIIPAYLGEVLDNHIPSNTSNHLGVSCTGALLAAIVLLGEDPANPYLEPYLSGILSKLEAHIDAGYLPDGSYAEPFAYFHMDGEMTVKAMACLLKNFGIDWTETKGIGKAWLYSTYTSTTSGQGCLDMGDALDFWDQNGTKPLLWASNRLRDVFAWDRYLWTKGTEISNKLEADFYDYLWAPVNLDPIPITQLPPSKWFWAKGFACFRQGWDHDDLHLLYKAGPHSNHYHLDQGNILLRYGGETLLDEGGYADYYFNGYYLSFYKQAVAHNTVLIGKYPESQNTGDLRNQVKALNRYPRILSCSTGNIIDALESELSPVYKRRVNEFRRSIVFPKPDYLILFDKIDLCKPELIQWLFHSSSKDSIHLNNSTCFIIRPNASLRMEIVQPRRFKSIIKNHPDTEKGVLVLSTVESTTETRFLSILIPSMSMNRDNRDKWIVNPIEYPGWFGVQVNRQSGYDDILFKEEGLGINTLGQYETDSDRFLVSIDPHGSISRLWARNAKLFAHKRNSVESIFQVTVDQTATFALQWRDSVLEIEAEPKDNIKYMVKTNIKPIAVKLNGYVQEFLYDPEQCIVSVSASKID